MGFNIRKNIVISFLLIIIIGVNIFLTYNYAKTGKQLNLSWSNTVSEYAEVAHGVSLDMDAIISNPLRQEDIRGFYTNLRLMEKQLESLGYLPYASEIIPYEDIIVLNNLTNYYSNVLSLIENDLKKERKISKDNIQRVKVLRQSWFEMAKNLSQEENKIDPFSAIFKKQSWENVWRRGLEPFKETELLPLPDNDKKGMGEN